jgi:hypothetical protein
LTNGTGTEAEAEGEARHSGLRSSRLLLRTTACAALLAVCTSPALAQQRPSAADTVVSLEALVVTADRAETPLAASVASVSR